MMEATNVHGTLNSAKMSGKNLEDEGTAKESLPFLIRIVLLMTWIMFGITNLFVLVISVFV
jgi:hypothetical protein